MLWLICIPGGCIHLLTLLGGAIGTYGTLIGAGGGIFLVPTLLVLYPQESPNTIASISLAVVFFNAASGTIAYARMRRVDYHAGLLFAAATVPGAILGAYATSFLSRQLFDLILSVVILSLAALLIVRPAPQARSEHLPRYPLTRHLTDAKGVDYDYVFSTPLGVGPQSPDWLCLEPAWHWRGRFPCPGARVCPAFSPACGYGHLALHAGHHEPDWQRDAHHHRRLLARHPADAGVDRGGVGGGATGGNTLTATAGHHPDPHSGGRARPFGLRLVMQALRP